MNSERYSLSNLRDIVLPDTPGFWPPAPGVWIVLGILAAVLIIICWKWFSFRKRNLYRKAGLALMGNVKTVYDLSVLLKRVALAVFPREQVASLYGKDWVDFLNQTCPECNFSEEVMKNPGNEVGRRLLKTSHSWIKNHRIN
jgi:hypothetical protein